MRGSKRTKFAEFNFTVLVLIVAFFFSFENNLYTVDHLHRAGELQIKNIVIAASYVVGNLSPKTEVNLFH